MRAWIDGLAHHLVLALLLSAIPLTISLISLLWQTNCALGDGVLFYLQIALPSALLAAMFGHAWRVLRFGGGWFVLFWIVTLVVSLLAGYYNVQLFTYGWQYGFFPGLIWDASLELTTAYLWFRYENALLAVVMLIGALAWRYRSSLAPSMRRALYAALVVMSVLYLSFVSLHDARRITRSHEHVQHYLSSTIAVSEGALIHYRGNTLTEEERKLLEQNTAWYLYRLRGFYKLSDTALIHIYLYPSVDVLYENLGTRNASVAKPWLSELHIAEQNLASLEHELVHVLLREAGSFPFYASWSTGLTEGAAELVETSYDGLNTVNEHAACILHLGLASGVERVMEFTGFASTSAGTAYVLAGSFSSYLVHQYGIDPYKLVYRSRDFEKVYGRPLRRLEAEWRAWLPASERLTAYDSLRTRYFFDRKAVIAEPCLRRVGKLHVAADEAIDLGNYDDADSIYQEIYAETKGISAIRGRMFVRMKKLDFDAAREIARSFRDYDAHLEPTLYLLKGDLGDTLYYDASMAIEMSDDLYEAAYVRMHMPDRPSYLRLVYGSSSPVRMLALDSSLPQWMTHYLAGRALEEEGLLSAASTRYGKTLEVLPAATSRDSLFRSLLELRRARIDPALDQRLTVLVHRLAFMGEFDRLRARNEYLRRRQTATVTRP